MRSRSTRVNERKFKSGQRFGKLTVIGMHPTETGRWACACECGRVEYRASASLATSKGTRQCAKCTAAQTAKTNQARLAASSDGLRKLRDALRTLATPERIKEAFSGRLMSTKDAAVELGLLDVVGTTWDLKIIGDWFRSNGAKKVLVGAHNHWTWSGQETKASNDGVGLVAGDGLRRDCVRWSSCLREFVKSSNAQTAHCPDGCVGFVPYDRARMLREAVDNVAYAQRGLNHEARA